MSTALILLLLLGTTYAATHVNISIAQQAATNPADVTFVDGRAPAELRAGPDFSYHSEERSSRLRQPESQLAQQEQIHKAARVQVQSSSSSSSSSDNGVTQNLGVDTSQQQGTASGTRNGPPMRRRNHMRRVSMQQRPHSGQFRQRSQQDNQNQEFERYVQTYGGPTVETVFESSSPAPQRQAQVSSFSSSSSSSASSSSAPQRQITIGGRPKHMHTHTFERQVALPAVVQQSANVEQQPDSKPIYEAPVSNAAVASSSVISSTPKAVLPSDSKVSFDNSQSNAGSGYNQPNFDDSTSYSKPSYDQNSYNYDDSQDLQDQYPPSVDGADNQGYNDYDDQSSYYGQSAHTPSPGYLPQRPVVTKTIQIVQPALKAKKYEVRHPAVQKEFYDIEERVVIKPAGTLVVELDHPVAKIPRGETVLPLGHPHPAVASAYNTSPHGVTQSQMSSGVYNNQNQYNAPKQAIEQPLLAGTPTVGSSVTTMPSYDQSSKDDFVESKLRQPYNSVSGDAQYVSTTEHSYDDQEPAKDVFRATDSNGRQVQINSKNLSPNMVSRDETDFRNAPRVDVQSNGVPLTGGHERSVETANYNPSSQYQGNGNNQFGEDYFRGEYISSSGNNAIQDSKPARLQQAEPTPQRHMPQAHVIKHEHNINLPPSQHNIYLSRSVQVPKEQRITDEEEVPARVSEVRSFLQRHPGGTVVYGKSVARPASNSVRASAVFRQRPAESARYRQPDAEPVDYSAPYSRMRYVPASESARLVQESKADRPLVVENVGGHEEKKAALPAGHTHIQIQIPHRDEVDKSIVVSSTISPPLSVTTARTANYRQFVRPYAVNPNHEVESFSEPRGDQSYGQLQSNSDCDQVDSAPRYRSNIVHQRQHFQRLVEAPATQATATTTSNSNNNNANIANNSHSPNLQTENVDVLLKSTAGHVSKGERVIAATPAPTDAASRRETFHKRRIVVNHPFQTVREVVEHEPITNYHQIQVNEPASPALYHHHAAYYQPSMATHGNLVYHQSSSTHGNLYAPLVHYT